MNVASANMKFGETRIMCNTNLTMSFTICCSQVVPDLGYGGMNRSSGLRGKSLNSSRRCWVMNDGKTIPFTTL